MSMFPYTQQVRGRGAGFTLLEMLVSTTLLSVVAVLLFSFFDQSTRAWRNSEGRIDAFREARAALYQVRRDLQAAVVGNGIHLLYNQTDTTHGPQIGQLPGSLAPAQQADYVFFISAQPQAAQAKGDDRSDLCAVGYYLALIKDDSSRMRGSKVSALHRYFYSSDETWQDGANPLGLLPHLQNPVRPLFRNASVTQDEVLARHITGFRLTPHTSTLLVKNPWPADEKPAFFELSLTAVSTEAAQKLSTAEDWYDDGVRADVKNAHRQTFTTRVALP